MKPTLSVNTSWSQLPTGQAPQSSSHIAATAAWQHFTAFDRSPHSFPASTLFLFTTQREVEQTLFPTFYRPRELDAVPRTHYHCRKEPGRTQIT